MKQLMFVDDFTDHNAVCAGTLGLELTLTMAGACTPMISRQNFICLLNFSVM